MKWSLQQLYKFNSKQFSFTATFDFKEEIKSIDDILDISEIVVEGIGKGLREDRYVFDLHITGTLMLEDAITLEAVAYPLDLKVSEIYDTTLNDDEDVRLIDKNTIDLKDAVWENIMLVKPMRFVKEELPE